MLKKRLTFSGNERKYILWFALVCMVALGASACGGLPSNVLTPTPTTLMGILPPDGQSTGIPAVIGASGTADATKVLDICALRSPNPKPRRFLVRRS